VEFYKHQDIEGMLHMVGESQAGENASSSPDGRK